MLDWILARLAVLARRLRRLERRELAALGRWIQHTGNLLHLTVLVAVPLLIAVVTVVSNALTELSFLLFPPLAAGAYTLFSDPEGRYASPQKFVVGLVAGALCGWAALALPVAPAKPAVSPLSAALSIFLTGVVTWLLDVEEPAAFSTALLVLVTDDASPEAYVASVALFGTLVAAVFAVWRARFYERRAQYLYESTSGDDHVLVPMRGDRPAPTATLAARLAAAHRAGKVVLLDLVDDEQIARAERSLLRDHGEARLATTPRGVDDADAPDSLAGTDAVSTAVRELEKRARTIETRVGVPCEVVVATDGDGSAQTVVRTAREANCDLVATPYETEHGALSPFVRELFRSDIDVLAHRSSDGRTRWRRVLVPVRGASDVAHSMIDFATRLAGETGAVSVATCITTERERRRAEELLADLVEPFEGHIETRVAQSNIEAFLAQHGSEYDLVILGASRDRSVASRLVSPPTFERIDSDEIGADVAVVDRR